MRTRPDRFRIHTNGKLRSIVTASGQGGLFLDWVALTRYSDATPESCGPLIHITEGANSEPADLTLAIEVAVDPDSDVEIRKLTITNHASHPRDLELTTYAEISLNHPMGDAGHPAFSKLFVQTAIAAHHTVLTARRRPRGMNENWPWMAQTVVGEITDLSWETNRASFLGRGRTPWDPAAIDQSGPLSGQTGNVLDPVFAWRFKASLAPGATKEIWLLTGAAHDEPGVLELLGRFRENGNAASAFEQATKAESDRLANLQIDDASAARYDALAGIMLRGKRKREIPATLEGSGILHRHPLSPDELRIIATAGVGSSGTGDILKALPYWKSLGLPVRLFVMDGGTGPAEETEFTRVDPTSLTEAEHAWWLASAQLVVGDTPGEASGDSPQSRRSTASNSPDDASDAGEPLLHFNGHGGFSADGREYVIPLDLESGHLRLPPMPWVNVLANPDFGCIVTERGAGYTWSRNSQANRLTPWSNDPIRDPHGEAFYLKDETSGETWSPLPGPCAPRSPFTVRHAFGKTTFDSSCDGLSQSVTFVVPPDEPIKLALIHLTNESREERKISFASHHRLLLGSSPDRHHAALAWTDESGIQHAENPRAGDFAGGRAFSFTVVHGAGSAKHTGINSTEAFIGAGEASAPDALNSGTWERQRGYGRDACFAARSTFTLMPGEEVEIVVGLGETTSEDLEQELIRRYRQPGAARIAIETTAAYWEKALGGVHVRTPLPEVDLMVNGWLLYQNMACRIWGRSAFYQSGGAYGFRDQLQDSGALASLHPDLMRSQILLHAAQQFPEGDVTHWWHPEPMGTGMRTKFSDDLLWLPYLTDHYVTTTGDASVFDESRPFIEGPLLGDHEDEEYMRPAISEKTATVFEHCCLAIDKSLTKGAHGLPLIGIGDWNDGMSRIGREGKGESVWMAFFLFTILNRWIPLCEQRGETARVTSYTAYRDSLLAAINDTGWDGEWYRRAYYDDGTPLGTKDGDECKIDALAQAWAVISKAAPEDRMAMSLDSLERELVDPEYDIIRLLHPPFVNTPHDPGYIKGYVAGVRENGGQYTHAACWVIRAMAEAGRRDKAAELLRKLSPVWHARDSEAVARYQVEPYVIAADIYGAEPHNGRGGWTWYTGSAGWMFRVSVESVLGLKIENGDTFVLDPRVPDGWPGYSIDYRSTTGRTVWHIAVENPSSDASRIGSLSVDGESLAVSEGVARWPMNDDGGTHDVLVTLGGHS